MLDMARTHPFVKGLAETRARAAGELDRCEFLAPKLDRALARARADVVRLQASVITLPARRARAQAELDACDLFLRKTLPGITPACIPSVNAWQGRYGTRGALKTAIAEFVRACAPAEVTTREIAWAVQVRLGLEFGSRAAAGEWARNTLGAQLRRFAVEGLIDRLHDPKNGNNAHRRWRWKKQRATTMAELRAMAAAAGIGTVQADDIPDGAPEGATDGVAT